MDFVHDEDENNIEFDESVISSSTQSLKDRFNKYKESHGEAVKEVEPEAQEVAQEEKEEENVSVNSVIQSLRDRLNAIKAKDAGSSDKENLTGVPSTSVEKPFIDVVVSQQVR